MVRYRYLLLLGSSFIFHSFSVLGQQSDTIYFNSKWQVCDEPIASYYRVGQVQIDSEVYFRGPVKDYYLDDVLQMEGLYSPIGQKHGRFNFYYPNGILQASGDFRDDRQFGIWEYYYDDGKLKSKIDYPGLGNSFTVLEFYDKAGKSKTKDGTVSFEIPGTDGVYPFLIRGEFRNKKRHGSWSYYTASYWKKEALKIREKYDDGVLKKGQVFGPAGDVLYSYRNEPRQVLIEYIDKFANTEIFSTDPLSFMRGSTGTLIDFLMNQPKPGISATGASFQESMLKVLYILNGREVSSLFREKTKRYSGRLDFYLDDSGKMSKIDVSGNINDQEKKGLIYVADKFKDLQLPSIENVGIETYHRVHFYTIDFRDYVQGDFLQFSRPTMILFTMIPYEQMEPKIREVFKKLR